MPALVWVHGGPGGQTRKGYSAFIQYLVNHGYAVLGINNRGSSGYGQKFFTADDRKHGHEPLRDCVEAKAFLAGLPYIDPERIGIIGGSYGGYMVLAALAFQPEEFVVGVDIFGVSNWLRTLESIPPYWEAQRHGALPGDRRPGQGPRDAQGHLARVSRRQDPPAAHGPAREERPAGHQARVRRHRRGGEGAPACPSNTSSSTTRATGSPRRKTRSKATGPF